MKHLIEYLAVGAAGFFGAIARLFVTRVCAIWFGSDFPVGTLVINLSGSLFLGWFLAVAGSRLPMSDALKLAVGVGFVGAYTTFSTFCFESNALLESGAYNKLLLNLIGSIVLGLLAVRLGMWLGGH